MSVAISLTFLLVSVLFIFYSSSSYELARGVTTLSIIGFSIALFGTGLSHPKIYRNPKYFNKILICYFAIVLMTAGIGSISYKYFYFGSMVMELPLFLMMGAVFLIPIEQKYISRFDFIVFIFTCLGIAFAIYEMAFGTFSMAYGVVNRNEMLGSRLGIAWDTIFLGIYLLYKNATSFSLYFWTALAGLFIIIITSRNAAFRRGFIECGFAFLMVVWLICKSDTINSKKKMVSCLLFAILLAVGILQISQIESQGANYLAFRSNNTIEDGILSDPRIVEAKAFFLQFCNAFLLIGLGPGSHWNDPIISAYFNPFRYIHINFVNYIFKIGIVGIGLWLSLLFKRIRNETILPMPYWAFLASWVLNSLIAGYKEISPYSFIVFLILANPHIFKAKIRTKRIRKNKKIYL